MKNGWEGVWRITRSELGDDTNGTGDNEGGGDEKREENMRGGGEVVKERKKR